MELIQFTRALSLRDPNQCWALLQCIQPSSNEAKFALLDECLFWSLRRNLLTEAKGFALQIMENQVLFQPWIKEHSKRLYQHFQICQAPLPLQIDCRWAKSIVPTIRLYFPDANVIETDDQQCYQPDLLFVEDEKEHESALNKTTYPFTHFVHVNWLQDNPFLVSELRLNMNHLHLNQSLSDIASLMMNKLSVLYEIRLSEQLDTSVGESEHLYRKVFPLPTKFKNCTFVLRILETPLTKHEEAWLQMDCFLIVFVSSISIQEIMQKRRCYPGMTFILKPTFTNPMQAHEETIKTLFTKNRRPERLQPHQGMECLLQQSKKYMCLKEAAQLNPFRTDNFYLVEKEMLEHLSSHKEQLSSCTKLFLHKLTPFPSLKEIKEDVIGFFSNTPQVFVSTSLVGGPKADVLWLVEQFEKTFIQGLYQYQRPLLEDTILSILFFTQTHRFV